MQTKRKSRHHQQQKTTRIHIDKASKPDNPIIPSPGDYPLPTSFYFISISATYATCSLEEAKTAKLGFNQGQTKYTSQISVDIIPNNLRTICT